MIVKIYQWGLLLGLAGCAAAPTIVHEPVEVQVPISVPCRITKPAAPTWALDAVSLDASLYDKTLGALAEIDQRIAYEGLLLTAIDGCQ